MKTIALVWGPFGHRMDELAAVVGARRVNITLLYGPRYFAPLRYLALFIRTLILLSAEGPDVVYAQNPPVFCPLAAMLYCRAAGRRLIVDHHSVWRVKTVGGSPLGRAIGFLESVVASRAAANTTVHSAWARELEAMGGNRILVVHDYVGKNPYGRDEALRRRYAGAGLLAIASHGGHPLERVEAEAAAAARAGSVTLLVTGPPSKLAERVRSLPANAKFLGLLPMEEYLRLKASCDFALSITDEPFTLSHVLFEYCASSLPVVSTRIGVVEETFGDALLYVESSEAATVTEKMRRLAQSPGTREEYRQRMARKFEELTQARKEEAELLKRVTLGS